MLPPGKAVEGSRSATAMTIEQRAASWTIPALELCLRTGVRQFQHELLEDKLRWKHGRRKTKTPSGFAGRGVSPKSN
jgi:hypothetical protein